MDKNLDVFISYKHTDENKLPTEDYYIAKQLFNNITKLGVAAFFSEQTLFSLGAAEYKKVIDSALEKAKILVVIGTSIENLTSPWVEYEYETFYADYLSGRKSYAEIISYTKNIAVNSLPRTLSRYQNFSLPSAQTDTVTEFILNSLKRISGENFLKSDNRESPIIPQTDIEEKYSISKNQVGHKSIYSSDYHNELNRLSIQSKNSYMSDVTAINHIFSESSWGDDEKICVLDIGSAYGHVAKSRFGDLPQVDKILCIDFNEKVLNRAKIIFAENKKLIFEYVDVENEDFVSAIDILKEKHNIEKFHIVFSALTLHHLKNPNKLLRKIRKIMSDDSFIMVRGSDDGSKLCYPKDDLMNDIINKTMEARGVSDRENGRKIYTQLTDSGYHNIKIFSQIRDLSQIDYDDRYLLFEESFSYRINYFKKALEQNPHDKKAAENYAWMEEALALFENQFFQTNFWYCEYDYIGVAKKI